MVTKHVMIRPQPLQIPVLDNNPQSNLERTTTVPGFNGDSLALVLRPLISPQRMLGWSLGIVYLSIRCGLISGRRTRARLSPLKTGTVVVRTADAGVVAGHRLPLVRSTQARPPES